MIKIVNYKIENPLTVDDGQVQLLVIESPSEFFSVVSELQNQLDGEDGDFVFKQNDKDVSFNKIGFLVTDLFNVDLNDKKLQNLLYKQIEKEFASDEDLFVQFNEINACVLTFLQNLSFRLPLAIEFDELSLQGVLKETVLKVQKTYDTFLEKIICFINLLVALKNIRLMVFVNLKSVLNDDDMQALYAHCQNEKVGLLLIESTQPKTRLKGEHMTIITSDLCEIVANN
ncbi:MAG: type II-A CRISPR-associated protein Csn2 [Clostridia bacterium]|nr:type II-A CRISPR-associated protein Csn2 [Clostridia bacterium]